MGKCGCGHCDCEKEKKTPEEKVKDLRNAIEELGYMTEETEEGEIRISNRPD